MDGYEHKLESRARDLASWSTLTFCLNNRDGLRTLTTFSNHAAYSYIQDFRNDKSAYWMLVNSNQMEDRCNNNWTMGRISGYALSRTERIGMEDSLNVLKGNTVYLGETSFASGVKALRNMTNVFSLAST